MPAIIRFQPLLSAALCLTGSLPGLASSRSREGAPESPPRPVALVIDSCSKDARILACRMSEGPWIDSGVTVELDSALARARSLRAAFLSIHPFPDFDLTKLLVKLRHGAGGQWRHSGVISGDRQLDSLAGVFRLADVRPLHSGPIVDDRRGLGDWFILRFGQSLNMIAV